MARQITSNNLRPSAANIKKETGPNTLFKKKAKIKSDTFVLSNFILHYNMMY